MRHSINVLVRPLVSWVTTSGLLGLAIMAVACGGEEKAVGAALRVPGDDGAQIVVVTTMYPLEYFAQRIGGESVSVINLVSPGVEAHDFEPTPADVRRLDGADLIIYNGSGFEPWMDRALAALDEDGRLIVEASRGLIRPLSQDGESDKSGNGPIDPHVWLDPLKAVQQVKPIRDGLIRVNPAASDAYARNAAALIDELEDLDRRFESGLADCRLRQFATAHDAFGHLATRYGLEAVPISGLSPEAEPSPRDLARLTERVRELGIKYVMAGAIVAPRLAETLSAEVGAELLMLHPMESLTVDGSRRGETYFSVMEANLRSLRTALECDQ